MSDRTVHAHHPAGEEIVRYGRGGKWYVELVAPSPDAGLRARISLGDAVKLALASRDQGGSIFLGRLGGAAFDRKVRA